MIVNQLTRHVRDLERRLRSDVGYALARFGLDEKEQIEIKSARSQLTSLLFLELSVSERKSERIVRTTTNETVYTQNPAAGS